MSICVDKNGKTRGLQVDADDHAKEAMLCRNELSNRNVAGRTIVEFHAEAGRLRRTSQ